MKGKTDSNRNEGEEFLSTYPVDNIVFCIIKWCFVFSYINISYFRPKMTRTL
jgi:hypothetical protein